MEIICDTCNKVISVSNVSPGKIYVSTHTCEVGIDKALTAEFEYHLIRSCEFNSRFAAMVRSYRWGQERNMNAHGNGPWHMNYQLLSWDMFKELVLDDHWDEYLMMVRNVGPKIISDFKQ